MRFPHCRLAIAASRIESKGFQTQQVDDLILTVAENRTRDFQLGISASATTVQVTASAVELEQATAETGGVVEPQQVNGLPINGRNWAGLMILIPGAINTA